MSLIDHKVPLLKSADINKVMPTMPTMLSPKPGSL
jgi:hypothetical protein